MNKRIKDITYDAIFLAILVVLVILFRYVLSILDTMIPLFISVLIGIRYHKENITRQIILSISLLAISFIFLDVISILLFILSGILLGIFAHYTLRIILNFPYFLFSTIIYFIVDCLIEFGYARLLLGLDFINYLESDMNLFESITSSLTSTGLIIIFFSYNLIVAIMESVILRSGVFIYERLLKNIQNKKN